jgi:protein transport protein SEC61 subunit gamma-like protein
MEVIQNISSFFVQCKRVWSLLRKPSKEEFTTIAKVSAIGLGIIGVLGFLIAVVMDYIYPK